MPYNFVPDSFHTGVMAEALPAKIDDFAPTRSLGSKISGRRGRPPPIIFARLVRPTLPLTVFTQSNFVADFLQAKSDFFYANRPFCVFETSFGGLRGNVRRSS